MADEHPRHTSCIMPLLSARMCIFIRHAKREHVAMGEDDQRLDSRWVEVGGLRMHARAATDVANAGALPLVLVHGLVVSSF